MRPFSLTLIVVAVAIVYARATAGRWTAVGVLPLPTNRSERVVGDAGMLTASACHPSLGTGEWKVEQPSESSDVFDQADAVARMLCEAACVEELLGHVPVEKRSAAGHQIDVIAAVAGCRREQQPATLFLDDTFKQGVLPFTVADWLVNFVYAGLLDGSFHTESIFVPLLLVKGGDGAHTATLAAAQAVLDLIVDVSPTPTWRDVAMRTTPAAVTPFPTRFGQRYAMAVGFDYDALSLVRVVFKSHTLTGILLALQSALPLSFLTMGSATGHVLPILPMTKYPDGDDGVRSTTRLMPAHRRVRISFSGTYGWSNDWHGIRNHSMTVAASQMGSGFEQYFGPHWVRLARASQFTLCPPGAGPTSYRVFEALAAGSIPVVIWGASFVGRGTVPLVLPYVGHVPWCDIAVFVHTSELDGLGVILDSISSSQQAAMRAKAASLFNRYFTGAAVAAHVQHFLTEASSSALSRGLPDCTEYPRVSIMLDALRDDGFAQYVRLVADTGRPTEQAARLLCEDMANVNLFLSAARQCRGMVPQLEDVVFRKRDALRRGGDARCVAGFEAMHTVGYRDVVCGRAPAPWWQS